MTTQAVSARNLTEKQRIAADMLGRCFDRKEIHRAAGLPARPATISEWLAIPEFQEAVAEANREYIAELREMKSRIIASSLELIEKELKDAKSKKRVDIAHSIAKQVI